ncbi:MAG: hypothetical protein GY697_24975 [Desulfobacterales bacterium]|nr:hypothetical protein [Desulfobacterales bacterium]
MQVKTELTSRGFQLSIDGDAWRSEPCAMEFPEAVWRSFPAKEKLVHELAYILTMAPPLILKHPTVWYHSPAPQFFDLYNECFEEAIPNLSDPITGESAGEILSRFRQTGRHFAASASPVLPPAVRVAWDQRRVVLPFSFGKDSLTSLATLNALGYEVFPVCLDDRVLPRGTAIRARLERKMATEQGIQCLPVRNEIQLLSDYQVLQRPLNHLSRVHIYFVYLLAMLPFCYYYRAPVIVVNYEYCPTLERLHRGGYLLPHRVMQTPAVIQKIRAMVEQLSAGAITVVDLIGGLGDFSINRLLNHTFTEFGAYRVSCHMEMSTCNRWCHQCYRCAHAYLFAQATGVDPAGLGFEKSMFNDNTRECYHLFRAPPHPRDAYARYYRQAEQLAFAMAVRRGVMGPLVDQFRQMSPPVNRRTVRKLGQAIFKVHGRPGKHPLEKEAYRFYRERIAGFRKADSEENRC